MNVDGETRDVSRRVRQRDDIDINAIDDAGRTNLERMRNGKPPIGPDGLPIQLHHMTQREPGTMLEITETEHKKYHSTLHGLVEKGRSFRGDKKLQKQYNSFRRRYWKWRAEQMSGGK